MGFYATDKFESAPPQRTSPPRARRNPPWGPKPLRGPIFHNAISGYRYYNPDLGRWVSRDPLKEQGELLLYGFVRNNPIGRIDFKGLYTLADAIGSLEIKGVSLGIPAIKSKP